MRILVFDIDGTLTQTNQIDGEFFKRAVKAALPDVVLESFRGFTEFTDAAILRDICDAIDESDYEKVESAVLTHFLDGLRTATNERPEAFMPVPGAREVFREVRGRGWMPAIATGGWRPSAELKLSTAQIPTRDVPLATSSEEVRRVDIIRRAVREVAGGSGVDEVVYVGDGTWDVEACVELEIGFVGRAPVGAEEKLSSAGATTIVPDFSDPAALLELLEEPDLLRPRSA